jgi:hypothetical protein
MVAPKSEYARLLHLAVEEETAAFTAQCRGDDMLLIEQHRRRAMFFRQQAATVAAKGRSSEW